MMSSHCLSSRSRPSTMCSLLTVAFLCTQNALALPIQTDVPNTQDLRISSHYARHRYLHVAFAFCIGILIGITQVALRRYTCKESSAKTEDTIDEKFGLCNPESHEVYYRKDLDPRIQASLQSTKTSIVPTKSCLVTKPKVKRGSMSCKPVYSETEGVPIVHETEAKLVESGR